MSARMPDIQISLSAIAEMVKFDLSHPNKETAGLLIGSEEDGVVHIDEIRVGDQKGNAVHVVISDEELTQAVIEVSERDDGKVIVGWWHTHPGLSAFLSGTDIKTQSIYQALMPNAVAIVIDDRKYSQTHKFDDLDFGVFRVIDGKAHRYNYGVKDSVEFGLAAFVQGEKVIVKAGGSSKQSYYAPTLYPKDIQNFRFSVNKSELGDEQKDALLSWLELYEASQTGDIKEIPVDAANLMNKLDESLSTIDDQLFGIEEKLANRRATRVMFLILFVLTLEAFLFLFVFGN